MRRRKQSGFALLLIFLMAAMIAISLYLEIPRIAFESQRQKELLLVDRGEQYQRAIQMFMKTNNRWPSKIEDLESFNNRRFLRRRFTDPMTGKEEWRFIHINNGILTDSLVNKPKTGKDAPSPPSGLVAEIPISAGDTNPNGTTGVNLALRRRASDGMTPGVGGDGTAPPVDPNNPNNPQSATGQPYPGMPLQPGQTLQPGQIYPPGVPIMPGQPGYTGVYPGQPAPFPGQYPGQPGFPGQPVNSQNGGVSPTPYPYPTTPGANGMPPGFPQPGMSPLQGGQQGGSNQAAQMIQQILTSPRPGGMPSTMGQAGVVGAGIAGVASTEDAEGILVYHDHTNYKEWEFIFDPTKVKPVPNPLTGAPGTSAAQLGSMPGAQGTQPGQPGCTAADPFSGGGTCAGAPVGFGPNPGGPVAVPPSPPPVQVIH